MNDFGEDEGQEPFSEGFNDGSQTGPNNASDPTGQSKPAQSVGSDIGAGERVGSSVYIANLQWWTTDADVERLCSTYGTVVNINFLAERSNGKSKGVALVEFSDSQAAARCKEGLSGCNIHGKNCVVTFPNQSYQRGYVGRYGGYYDRGRMDGRGRARYGRGYGYDSRPMGMHMMGEVPGYMHDMGMVDMTPDMMGMPPMESGPVHGSGYVPPPPYGMMGGYMHDERYDQGPYYRRTERWDPGMDGDDMSQKRQRPTS